MRTPNTRTHPDLDAFLHAKIGEDRSGLVVTVASAIARSGKDPWKEAAHLAGLTPAAAAQLLVPMIARTPQAADASDARAAADRLIGLLPKWLVSEGSPPSATRRSAKTASPSTPAIWMLCIALAIAALFWTTRASEPSPGEDKTGTPWSADIPSNS